jgi:hypothetical protein
MAVDNVGMRESLIEAGLVDPSGAFTSAPNFGGPPEATGPAPRPAVEQDGEAQVTEQAAEPQAAQEQVAQTQAAPVPTGSDLGPQTPERLGDAADPIRQEYEQTVSQLDHMAQLAFMQGRTLVGEDGQRLYSDEHLAREIGRELETAKQQAYLAGIMKRMQPVAQRAVAEKIAAEHGVEVSDIINESSPVAMTTRAKTIAELKRDGRFQERKASGTDQAEGSRGFSNAIPEAIERMSPQQKMYIGFARGDN